MLKYVLAGVGGFAVAAWFGSPWIALGVGLVLLVVAALIKDRATVR